MFYPLPAALLWVTEIQKWPGWGRRAATKPGCWAKRDRTATGGGDNAGGSQGRSKIVGVEAFNYARVEVDRGEAKVGPVNGTSCPRSYFLILQLGAVRDWQAKVWVILSHLTTLFILFCLACSLSQTKKRRCFHRKSIEGLVLRKKRQHL